MPYSVNGIGTEIVIASKRHHVGGHDQYDAVEAFVILGMPLVPYKALHVFNSQPHGMGERYQSFPLRWTFRLFAKAMLNGWGSMLLLLAGAATALFSFASLTMERPFVRTDAIFLGVLAAATACGLMAKVLWYVMDRRDTRIRNILGPHQFGSSDPYDWPDEIAQAMESSILEQHASTSLVDVAEKAMNRDQDELAMMCVRLALRTHLEAPEARDLLLRLLMY